MTQPLPSESIEYERYVDGLRLQIHQMTSIAAAREKQFAAARKERDALNVLSAKLFRALEMYLHARPAFRLKPIGAPGSAARQEQADAIAAEEYARATLLTAKREASSVPKTITIHVEGGLVQDVTGIPPGVEVRVEDYDHSDMRAKTWDAEKNCHVTVYGGDGA